MTQDMASNIEQAKVAAITAAVQAYLDGEIRGSQSQSPAMNGWREVALPFSNDVFALRRRAWTGRY